MKSLKIIRNLFAQCHKHKEVFEWSFDKIIKFYPFGEDKLLSLKVEDKALIDAFIFRFSKLQDTLGRIFWLIIEIIGEGFEEMTFIDVLNECERIGIVESSREWLFLRQLRNEISHEYELDYYILAKQLNTLIESASKLIDVYNKVESFIDRNITSMERDDE